jgi:hypothetical protein
MDDAVRIPLILISHSHMQLWNGTSRDRAGI